MQRVRDLILNSRIVKKFYSMMFYFEQGKAQINRFYNEIPQMIIILGGLKYLFDISFTPLIYVMIFIVAFTVFTVFGYFIKHSGLWDTDRIICATKDPVQSEIYRAAQKINKGGKL